MAGIGTRVKFTLAADQVPAGLAAFGLADRVARRHDVYFVDTLDEAGDPRLYGLDVVVRVRRRGDDSGDVTVLLRPADRNRLIGRWRPGTEHRAAFRVEHDWAHRKVLAASVEAAFDSGVGQLLNGPRKGLLTAEQQHFVRNCAGTLDQPFRDVRNVGPVVSLTWPDLPAAPMPGLRAQRWSWGDRAYLELSLRCATDDEATARRALFAAELERHGLKPDDSVTTKTETVLRDLL